MSPHRWEILASTYRPKLVAWRTSHELAGEMRFGRRWHQGVVSNAPHSGTEATSPFGEVAIQPGSRECLETACYTVCWNIARFAPPSAELNDSRSIKGVEK